MDPSLGWRKKKPIPSDYSTLLRGATRKQKKTITSIWYGFLCQFCKNCFKTPPGVFYRSMDGWFFNGKCKRIGQYTSPMDPMRTKEIQKKNNISPIHSVPKLHPFFLPLPRRGFGLAKGRLVSTSILADSASANLFRNISTCCTPRFLRLFLRKRGGAPGGWQSRLWTSWSMESWCWHTSICVWSHNEEKHNGCSNS